MSGRAPPLGLGATRASLFAVGGASLLPALEAREHYSVAADEAILLGTERALSSGLLRAENWRAIYRIPANPRGRGLERIRHWRCFAKEVRDALRDHGPYVRAFLSDCGEPMQFIAGAAQAMENIVLDDGLATVVAAHRRRSRPARTSARNLLRRALKGALVLSPLRDLGPVTFFTAYDIVAGPEDRVIRHAYPRLRRSLGQRPTGTTVYFVGQPLVENGSLTRAAYERLVGQACERIKGPTVYVAHPNESDERVASLASSIGVAWQRFTIPFEQVLAHAAESPACVAGFSSSVLANCAVAFPEVRVVAFEIPATAYRVAARAPDLVMRFLSSLRIEVQALE